MKRWRKSRAEFARLLVCLALLFPAFPGTAPHARQQKDYLTSLEADKIRDAETPDRRIKLFVGFAADRLKKLQYELSRPIPEDASMSNKRQRQQRLNGLLNAYLGCVDDAAELVELAREKQDDVRAGIKDLQKKGPEFLSYLVSLTLVAEQNLFSSTLEDALEGTREALKTVEKAEKEIAPPPVRRRQ